MTRTLVWGGLILVVVLGSLVLIYGEPDSKQKNAFRALSMKVGLLQQAEEACWAHDKTLGMDCKGLETKAVSMNSETHYYFVSTNGVLIGLDFSNQVIVEMSPITSIEKLEWRCRLKGSGVRTGVCSALP